MNHTTAKNMDYLKQLDLPTETLEQPESDAARALKSTMGQNWTHNKNNNTWSDQYGFDIVKYEDEIKPFTLFHWGVALVSCYRLHTAKLFSIIYINDIILHKQNPDNDQNTKNSI